MSASVTLSRAGPGITVQDLGRPGYIGQGLSRGGAADRHAILAAAALLDQVPTAAMEMPPVSVALTFEAPARIALTGAAMRATLGDAQLAWNASHRVEAGQTLSLAPVKGGYGYVSFGGGIATEPRLGSRSAHLAAGLGRALEQGDELPLGADEGGATNRVLDADDAGDRPLRLLPSAHTALFDARTLARFEAAIFTRDRRGNRQGVKLDHAGDPFATTANQLSLVSEIARPGDIQMTGDGVPYLLGPECQTTGGYPRIGAVLPQDLPRAIQAPPGAELRVRFVSRDEALSDWLSEEDRLARMRKAVRPLTRDPRDIRDLGRYQLISGVTAGRPDQEDQT
jgi:5-oxoprolinase (ATP-hydrolysing) subunit C